MNNDGSDSYHYIKLYGDYIASNICKNIKNNKYICNRNNYYIQKYKKLNAKDPFTLNPIIAVNKKINIFLKDMVYVKTIKHGNNKLIGQKGLFAASIIPKHTTLGIYRGSLYDSADYINQYGVNDNDLFEIITKYGTIIAKPSSDKMILRFINDARLSANEPCLNKINVEGVQTSIHKIPCIIFYSKRTINRNEQLFIAYGSKYWSVLNNNDL